MKRKKWIPTILMTGALGILMGVFAAAEANTGPDLETLFYTYSQDNMVFDYYDSEFVYPSMELEQNLYDGFLALEQLDLNWDGEEELLAIRVKGEEDENGTVDNKLIAEIYQYQGDRLQRIAQYILAEEMLRNNAVQTDVFLVKADTGIVLCCEKKENWTFEGDGIDWSFRAAAFDGSQFVEKSTARIDAYGWLEEEENAVWNALSAVGLYPADVIDTNIADQVGNVEKINSIRRYLVTDQRSVLTFLYEGSGESMQYGETCFHSSVNEGIQNKINKEFAVVMTAPNAAANDDYIIPDISSRYITEADLVNLSEYEILLARNEIYAKHGRKFNNQELNEYFSSKSWYQPTVEGADFTEEYAAQVFNEIEMTNIGFIVQYENAHGLNQY